MKVNVVNRMVAVLGISALAMLGTGIAVNAAPQRGQQQDQKDKKQQQDKKQQDQKQQDQKQQAQQVRQAEQTRQVQVRVQQAEQARQTVTRQAEQARQTGVRQAEQARQIGMQRAEQARQTVTRQAEQVRQAEVQRAARVQQAVRNTPVQLAVQPLRLAVAAQQSLIGQQQQRLVQYGDFLNQQQRVSQVRTVELQRSNRTAQYSVQLQYVAGINQLQARLQSQRNYNYGGDVFFFTAPTFRYVRAGQYYQTSQRGADLLRQAVNFGYEQGIRAGMADRQDGWRSDYANAYGYQDANYGYTGFYVDRYNYNFYFREGFRRGYQDGYGRHYQYGTYVNGRGTLLGAIAATILNFQSIR